MPRKILYATLISHAYLCSGACTFSGRPTASITRQSGSKYPMMNKTAKAASHCRLDSRTHRAHKSLLISPQAYESARMATLLALIQANQ